MSFELPSSIDDPFLAGHIEKYASHGRGDTSYLSSITCDEFVNLMGSRQWRIPGISGGGGYQHL